MVHFLDGNNTALLENVLICFHFLTGDEEVTGEEVSYYCFNSNWVNRRTETENQRSPDEGKLLLIHAGIQSKTGVLSKRRNDQAEHQGNAHKHCREDDLKNNTMKTYYIEHT